jgi:DNA (cytosine-5)-methyltransferase 1
MKSVELFSGCGGLALGLSRAGFHHELMVEWNQDAVATVHHNQRRRIKYVSDWPIAREDVRKINWSRFSGELHLVAGGPPCQPFSVGGKHKGAGDVRDMWPEAIRAVREALPQGFIFENVRGIARPAFATYLSWIRASLERPQIARMADECAHEHLCRVRASSLPPIYDVEIYHVNAADFGAPQKRHRVIIAGIRRDGGIGLTALKRTHSRERLLWDQWVTGAYWIKHGITAPSEKTLSDADARTVHDLRSGMFRPTELPWITVRDSLKGLGEPTGRRNHVLQPGARTYPGHTGSNLDAPAKALKAGDHGVPGGENMMITDDGSVRYFTLREAARLQGLPDTYTFPTSWSESMRQLGNAVPSQLAKAVGCWMANQLAGMKKPMLAA